MRVQDFLRQKHVPFEVLHHPPAETAHELARQTSTEEHEVAKTVLLRADRGFSFIVALTPADCCVDLDKVSQALGGSQIELASDEEVNERCPDSQPGALPPFGSQYKLQTLVDPALAEEEEIVFEGDTHEEAIRMRWEDFQQIENPLVVAIAREE